MRSFIAIELSPELKLAIQAVCDGLKALGVRASFPSTSGLHLTLKFLGEVDPELILELQGVLQRCCPGIGAFSIRLSGMGAFPHLASPRVVWLGVEPSEQLFELQYRIEQELSVLRFEKEDRDFHPHVTVARIRSARRKKQLIEYILSNLKTEVGESLVEWVHLFQSHLGTGGTRHEKLHSVML